MTVTVVINFEAHENKAIAEQIDNINRTVQSLTVLVTEAHASIEALDLTLNNAMNTLSESTKEASVLVTTMCSAMVENVDDSLESVRANFQELDGLEEASETGKVNLDEASKRIAENAGVVSDSFANGREEINDLDEELSAATDDALGHVSALEDHLSNERLRIEGMVEAGLEHIAGEVGYRFGQYEEDFSDSTRKYNDAFVTFSIELLDETATNWIEPTVTFVETNIRDNVKAGIVRSFDWANAAVDDLVSSMAMSDARSRAEREPLDLALEQLDPIIAELKPMTDAVEGIISSVL